MGQFTLASFHLQPHYTILSAGGHKLLTCKKVGHLLAGFFVMSVVNLVDPISHTPLCVLMFVCEGEWKTCHLVGPVSGLTIQM